MPTLLFTSETSREMNRKRWDAFRQRKANPDSITRSKTGIPDITPSDDYTVRIKSRVRKQWETVADTLDAELAKRSPEPQAVDRLCAALERLAEVERVLDGRPLPGSRRPAAERGPKGQVSAWLSSSPQPIQPAQVATVQSPPSAPVAPPQVVVEPEKPANPTNQNSVEQSQVFGNQ